MTKTIIDRKVGATVRRRRKELGLTLEDLAARVQLTAAFLSQMERGLCSPSLSSLLRITQALDTTLDAALGLGNSGKAHVQQGERTLWGMGDSGRFYEKLGPAFAGARFYPAIVHRPPGHVSEHMNHPGEAFCYLLAGELEYHLDDEVFIVRPGDTIHFDTQRLHYSVVTSATESIELWVTTLPAKNLSAT